MELPSSRLFGLESGVLEMNYRQGGSEMGPLIVHPAGDTIPACT